MSATDSTRSGDVSSFAPGVVIENARLREDAFDYLQLPFKVQYGCIGRLQLQVGAQLQCP